MHADALDSADSDSKASVARSNPTPRALEAVEERLANLEKSQQEDCLSMVVFSGDYDKLIAAIRNGHRSCRNG